MENRRCAQCKDIRTPHGQVVGSLLRSHVERYKGLDGFDPLFLYRDLNLDS